MGYPYSKYSNAAGKESRVSDFHSPDIFIIYEILDKQWSLVKSINLNAEAISRSFQIIMQQV